MASSLWTPELSVHIKEIDDQHEQLLEFFEEWDHMTKSKEVDQKTINIFFDKLLHHAQMHFGFEEKYFLEFNYEYGEAHTKEHNKIKEKIFEFKNKFNQTQSADTAQEVIEFLKDWMYGHIMNYDKKYVDCFISHGLS